MSDEEKNSQPVGISRQKRQCNQRTPEEAEQVRQLFSRKRAAEKFASQKVIDRIVQEAAKRGDREVILELHRQEMQKRERETKITDIGFDRQRKQFELEKANHQIETIHENTENGATALFLAKEYQRTPGQMRRQLRRAKQEGRITFTDNLSPDELVEFRKFMAEPGRMRQRKK
jgi:hypothetical protein